MSGWQTVHLGKVADFVRGINFKPDDVVPVGTAGSVACMRTKNVQTKLDLSDVWAVDESFVSRNDQLLNEGDILVSSANSWNLVGKCSWIPPLPWRTTFGGFVSALRPIRDKIEPRFLFHWFSSTRIQTTLRSFGQQTTNISNLNIARCLKLEIPLPPLPEQQRIAAVLDKAEELRAKRRAALALLDSLSQAIFLEIFGEPIGNPKGWPVVKLADLIVDGPQNGLYKHASDYGTGTPILRIDAFYDGAVTKLANLKRVRITEGERDLFGLRPDDIVINRVNSMEYLGKSALIPELSEPTVFESNMMRFAVDPTQVNQRYFVDFLQSSFIKGQIINSAKHAVNQSSINQQDVKGFLVNVPPLPLQQEFARRIAAVEKLKTAHRTALAELDALFASLQHRAFRGEL